MIRRIAVVLGAVTLSAGLVGCGMANQPFTAPVAHGVAGQRRAAVATAARAGAPKKAAASRQSVSRAAAGRLVVPGTGLAIGATWGTLPAPAGATHRPWPAMHAKYQTAAVRCNPVYLHDLDSNTSFDNRPASWQATTISLLNIPWFCVNLAITPALMVAHPPFEQVTSSVGVAEPIYNGFLPRGGRVLPKMGTGYLYWPYPRVRPLTSVPTH